MPLKSLKKYKIVNSYTGEFFKSYRSFKTAYDTVLALNYMERSNGKFNNPWEIKYLDS